MESNNQTKTKETEKRGAQVNTAPDQQEGAILYEVFRCWPKDVALDIFKAARTKKDLESGEPSEDNLVRNVDGVGSVKGEESIQTWLWGGAPGNDNISGASADTKTPDTKTPSVK